MNNWDSTRRFFEYSGMFFVGVVIPASAAVYIFVVRPVLAIKEKSTKDKIQTTTVSRYYKDRVAGSADALNDLVDYLRDSLIKEHVFAPGLPESSILLQRTGDFVSVIIQFNIDCGCPMEGNRFDALCFVIDWYTGEPAVTQSFSRKGIPRDLSLIDIYSTVGTK